LFSEEISIDSFDKATMEWTLSTEDLEEPVLGISDAYTVKIIYGEVARRIVVILYYPVEGVPSPPKY
jgi:hypothetical protein